MSGPEELHTLYPVTRSDALIYRHELLNRQCLAERILVALLTLERIIFHKYSRNVLRTYRPRVPALGRVYQFVQRGRGANSKVACTIPR